MKTKTVPPSLIFRGLGDRNHTMYTCDLSFSESSLQIESYTRTVRIYAKCDLCKKRDGNHALIGFFHDEITIVCKPCRDSHKDETTITNKIKKLKHNMTGFLPYEK